MLVLSRKAEQSLRIGPDVEVVVLGVRGSTVRLGIRAPRRVPVVRTELEVSVVTQNQEAAASLPEGDAEFEKILGELKAAYRTTDNRDDDKR